MRRGCGRGLHLERRRATARLQAVAAVLPSYFDIVAERAEGSWLWDVEGRRYLDLGGASDPSRLEFYPGSTGDWYWEPLKRRSPKYVTADVLQGEVLGQVGLGLNNAEIAERLFMSVSTVKTYVSRTLAKLRLDNGVQAALLAGRLHLTPDDHPPGG